MERWFRECQTSFKNHNFLGLFAEQRGYQLNRIQLKYLHKSVLSSGLFGIEKTRQAALNFH